jgi:hypothetical protein
MRLAAGSGEGGPITAIAWAPAADSCGTFRTFRGR